MKSFPLAHQAFLILGLLATPLAHADPGILAEFDYASQTVSVTVTEADNTTSELVVSLAGTSCAVSVSNFTTGEILFTGETNYCLDDMDILMAEVAALAGDDVVAILRMTAIHIALHALHATAFTPTERQPTDSGLIAPSALVMDSDRHENVVDAVNDKVTLNKGSLEPQTIEHKDAAGLVLSWESKFPAGTNTGYPQKPSITK